MLSHVRAFCYTMRPLALRVAFSNWGRASRMIEVAPFSSSTSSSQGGKISVMAKTIATLLGVVLILVGIIGFFVGPSDAMHANFIGTHLTTSHNLVHIITGAVALYFGMAASLSAARLFCIIFGVVYALLGVCGFLLGTREDRMFDALAALGFHLRTMDHVLDILVGLV